MWTSAAKRPWSNTTDATLGNNFNARQLTDLPSEGRDPVAILSLQPGVVYIGTTWTKPDDSRGGSVNGARSDQTNVTLDGLDDNDQLNGFAFQGAMRATMDSLQEFRVTTSNYDASAGRSSGAQVNLVTKSGTNRFTVRCTNITGPTFTVANDWFNKQAELPMDCPTSRNTFCAILSVEPSADPSRRIVCSSLRAYEGQRTADQTQVSRIVPTPAWRPGS